MAHLQRYIVGLDVGTTKVCAVIGEADEHAELEIVGAGLCPMPGQKKGVVVDIEATVEAIKNAVEEAELMAGVSIDRAWIGTSGTHLRGFNSRGDIELDPRGREIDEQDVRRVVDAAAALDLPPDREIVHLLPQEFLVDGQDEILDPIGMSGSRLEVNLHLVVASGSALQNLVNCANRGGLEVQGAVFEALAANEAVLTDDERQLGTALVDIGGGTTDMVCFRAGTVCHTAVLPTGGNHFTKDVGVGLRTPLVDAERIKLQHGGVLPELVPADQVIEVPGIGGRPTRLVPRRQVCEILKPRAVEILDLIGDEIRRAGVADCLHAGIVFTGGGALLEGLAEIAEQRLGVPVRLGKPGGVTGLTDVVAGPSFAVAVGLALYGFRRREADDLFSPPDAGSPGGWRDRLVQWLARLF